MSYVQRDGQLRSPVATYSALPITGNVLSDIRIVTDLGDAYAWISSNPTGTLSDWKKLTVSSYTDLVDRPNATAAEINNATEMIPNLILNNFILSALNYFSTAGEIIKLFDGMFDRYGTDEGINLSELTNAFLNKASLAFINPALVGWMQLVRGPHPIDINTRMLIDCRSIVDINGQGFVDFIRNSWGEQNMVLDTTNKKFGTASLSFNGTNAGIGGEMDFIRFKVKNKDFSYDFWMRPVEAKEAFIVYDNSIHIKQMADNTIFAKIFCADYGVGNPTITEVTVQSTATVSLNTWTHVAVQRRNGYLEVYINGVLDSTSATADTNDLYVYNDTWYLTYPTPSMVIYIGTNAIDNSYHGNLDEIRYSYDVTRYTGNFTPNTIGYNTLSDSEDVKVLIHANQTNGDTTIIDEKGHTVTTSGTSIITTSTSKFGTGSVNFPYPFGYLSIADNPDTQLGTGNFTIDTWCWLEPGQNTAAFRPFFMLGSDQNSAQLHVKRSGGSGNYDLVVDGTQVSSPIITGYSLPQATWFHLALVRNGNTLTVYVDGVSKGSTTITGADFTDGLLRIGGNATGGGGDQFYGKMDEFRLVKGTAVWTSNFTPKTTEHTDVISTVSSVVQSTLFSANYIPSSARIIIAFEEMYDPITPNEDIQAYVSRDGGATFTSVVLGLVKGIIVNRSYFLTGIVDLTNQPVGKNIVYKVVINNNKDIHFYATGMLWK